jgi:hypothetical protein
MVTPIVYLPEDVRAMFKGDNPPQEKIPDIALLHQYASDVWNFLYQSKAPYKVIEAFDWMCVKAGVPYIYLY